jgi:colanic acid/amylovoran biosynthesis glycosyltransferase
LAENPIKDKFKMRICFITTQSPFGIGETFILEEMLEVKRQGIDLLIIPRNPSKEIFHKEGKKLLGNVLWLPLINFKILSVCLITLLTNTTSRKILKIIIRYSRNTSILIKNLMVFPKGILIAGTIKKKNIEHIHAHWGSTTATMAYIVSKLTNIPWSFTLHRWDIKEDNMLKEKVKSAELIRCISKHGEKELLEIVGGEYKEKTRIIHMGVKVPANMKEFAGDKKVFTIVVPANLIEVKGHVYLIEACFILIQQGIKNFQCIFYGEGPLGRELENLIEEKKITDYIKMPGAIPHENLIEMYKNKKINAVVLPSITTNKGEHEGIPVSLMEAMAYGIPVISTNTGGIPELLSDGAGMMVQEKSSTELAEAILKLVNDKDLSLQIAIKEYNKISIEFNIENTSKELIQLISGT